MHFTNVKNVVSPESLHCYPAKGESAQARPPAPQDGPPEKGVRYFGDILGGKLVFIKNPYISECCLVLRVFWGNFGDVFLNFEEFWGCRLFP